MAPDRVIEPVDVLGDGVFGLLAGLPCDLPDQLRLDGLEERFHHRVVVAVPAPAHRDQDAAPSEQRLIVDRAVLRSTVGMVHQLRRRVASHESTAQRFDREVALQSVTRGSERLAESFLLAFRPGNLHMSSANVFLRPSASVLPASVDLSV